VHDVVSRPDTSTKAVKLCPFWSREGHSNTVVTEIRYKIMEFGVTFAHSVFHIRKIMSAVPLSMESSSRQKWKSPLNLPLERFDGLVSAMLSSYPKHQIAE